jgi:hypothetical protein
MVNFFLFRRNTTWYVVILSPKKRNNHPFSSQKRRKISEKNDSLQKASLPHTNTITWETKTVSIDCMQLFVVVLLSPCRPSLELS